MAPSPGSGSLFPASESAHYTHVTNTSPNLRPHPETLGPPTHRELILTATSVLWHTLQPYPGNRLDPPVVTGLYRRLKPLIELGCVWEESSITGSTAQLGSSCTEIDASAEEKREREVFTKVLQDGHVLCR